MLLVSIPDKKLSSGVTTGKQKVGGLSVNLIYVILNSVAKIWWSKYNKNGSTYGNQKTTFCVVELMMRGCVYF